MPSKQVSRTLIIINIHGRNAASSVETRNRHRLVQERGRSFLIRLPVRPPLPIVDLPREIAESPRTSCVLTRAGMEQCSVGEDCV
jgi:hypothetical protein